MFIVWPAARASRSYFEAFGAAQFGVALCGTTPAATKTNQRRCGRSTTPVAAALPRHVAGETPTVFLSARLKAASDSSPISHRLV
jgi:hypothetical protein